MTDSRSAIIVGGAGGIGSVVGRRLAAQGHRITIADINEEAGKQVLAALPGLGHTFVRVDIFDEASIAQAFADVEQRDPAAILVLSAGGPLVMPGPTGNILALAKSDFERTLSFNVTSVFSCVQAFARQRVERPLDNGRIVIIGSAVGLVAATGTDIGYVTAKAAIFGLSREIAATLVPYGVTVNVVAPGPVATEEFVRKTTPELRAGMAAAVPLKRLVDDEEVGAGVAYLVSPDAAIITGTVLDINGGVHMR